MKKLTYLRNALVLLLATAFTSSAVATQMTAHSINFGQGHATLMEFPCGAILIDTGAQDPFYVARLTNYLNHFFIERPDLDRTLDSVILTHQHKDHTLGAPEIINHFKVLRVIENGLDNGSGIHQVRKVRKYAASNSSLRVRSYSHDQIGQNGLIDSDIDPLKCSKCDPKVTLLAGRHDQLPIEWARHKSHMKEGNNHSLVTRFDFGQFSFLFVGDLENPAGEVLMNKYAGTSLLDVDYYQVGHHGADNGTSSEFIAALTPKVAFIPVGSALDTRPWTAYQHGHPRKTTVDILFTGVSDARETVWGRVAIGQKVFRNKKLTKAVYANSWDGTIRFNVDLQGNYTVERQVTIPNQDLRFISSDVPKGASLLPAVIRSR